MNRRVLFSGALFIFFLCISQVVMLAQESLHIIHLRSGDVHATANAAAYIDSVAGRGGEQAPMQVVVQFSKVPGDAQRALLTRAGLTLMEYIPDNSYLATLQMPIDKEQLLALGVYSIVGTRPEWKYGDYVKSQIRHGGGAVKVLVSLSVGTDLNGLKAFATARGGSVHAGRMDQYGIYEVSIDATQVNALAGWYGVKYISPVHEMVPLDLESRPAVKGNIAVAPPADGGYGLTGDSVTVGVGDNASGIYHIDLKERITNFNPGPMSAHGEHVNGIVGSAAIVDPLAGSMASHVSLVDFLYDLILPAVGTMYQDHNMTITNNSYEVVASNCDYAGTYDIYSQFLDTLAIQFPYVQNVFASGNDGLLACSPYLPGFANVGGGYQPAKNNIVVGSMTDYLLMAGDESRGPVRDGRLKPEIVATGLGAYSTIGVDNYEWAAGTSMASPQVAGGLALLTQQFKRVHGVQPRAELLKAILLNGAMEQGNPGPDFCYGFGIMDMNRSLKIIDSARFRSGAIATGDSQLYHIAVPANMGQLKVMLVWNDVPGSALASKELVNDLDLTVTTPTGIVHLPLCLDATPANVSANATEKTDHLNNTEQVTVNNPPAGIYTFKIKGFSVPFGPQQFALAYDMKPGALQLTYPLGGEQLWNSTSVYDSMRIFWDAISDGNTFTVQMSSNDGAAWTTLAANEPADARRYDFIMSGLSSGKCRVRVMRNNTTEVMTSQKFVVNTPPTVTADTAQCPGYINIHWSPVLNATSYYLMKKVGKYMQVVDLTTDTFYTFSNMPLTEKSYVAVQPIIDGLPGYRSNALIMQADAGNCTKPVSSGDLMVEKMVSANAGRQHTSTELGTATNFAIRLRNLYNSACNNYTLSYQVDGGVWQTLTTPAAIPAHTSADVTITGLPVAATGPHSMVVAIHNLDAADPVSGNDTLSLVITSLPNDTIDLTTPFTDGFETAGKAEIKTDSIGVLPNGHWDFFHSDPSGRLRTFVNNALTITGSRSISIDQDQNKVPASKNTFVGTFNLGSYDTANAEVRLDFDYYYHGTPSSADGNVVRARGVDTTSWHDLYQPDISAYAGTLLHAKSLSLTDACRLSRKNFSSSFQLSFGQSDTSLIAAYNYGNGLTLDNVKIYTVANDAALVSVVSPVPSNCGLSSAQPLTVQVHNGVNHTLYGIQMFYSLDGGPTNTGTIDSIKGKASVNFTFPQPVSVTTGATHSVTVWLSSTGDTYTGNDTILNYHYRNSQIVTIFPYLENFEQGDGGYFSDGFKNSWQFGTPASQKISKAASGIRAWKTNLTGHYSNLERSYLYSPCFDISGLVSPMLSFSMASDIENCGRTLCDAAWVEVSFDGQTWTKLGSVGQGTNWYDSTFNLWNTQNFTRWHVASVPLPQPGPGVSTHFRFVLNADPGVTFDGLAIDDIHVFDRNAGILPSDATTNLVQNVSGDVWNDYVQNGQLLASVEPHSQSIGYLSVTQYRHDTLHNPGSTQFTFARSYLMKAPTAPDDSVGVRLFLTEADVLGVLADTTCNSCTPVDDAYSLGITEYSNKLSAGVENGTLKDDTGGAFVFYPHRSVKWVPYDNGYYAEIKAKPLSEFWFNNGGPTGTFPAGTDYLDFIAYRNGSVVTTSWHSLIDTIVDTYTGQWSLDSIHFADFTTVPALHLPVANYTADDPVNFPKYPIFYYRLQWTQTGSDQLYYSPVRKVTFADSASTLITLDAHMVNRRDVLVEWTSYLDGFVSSYKVERASGSSPYFTIGTLNSLRHYGQGYTLVDQPGGSLPTGTVIHYRLTAIMDNGTTVVLPERTVTWIDGSAIVDVYPNPTHDGSFTIAWDADPGTRMQIALTDASGRDVFQQTVTATQWSNLTTLGSIELPKGLYFARLIVDGRKYVRKIVFE